MSHTITRDFRECYLAAVLGADRFAADRCVGQALEGGVGVAVIYLDVLAPALVEVGERWHRGELNVAQEHLATEITRGQMDRLRGLAAPTGPAAPLAVVAAVQEELHDVGAAMVADLLTMDGWSVDFLGANTPVHDLVEYVDERKPSMVVLSVTMPPHLDRARDTVRELHDLPDPPRVLLGGQAFSADEPHANGLDAYAITGDAWEAVQHARALIESTNAPHTLDQLLKSLGQRIREARRSKSWSQQQLASKSGLDRSYVNAVEQGKQNLTLGATIKLADAMGVSLDRLLFS
jgi:methanogenic corrinoid protein MtbC1/DNA-binding XRE family transcriptional regulator